MVIADEPVSALDVSVAAAVTELLMEIQREHKTTLLFISHDLSVVRYLSDRIVVMYLGQIMERGSTEAIFAPRTTRTPRALLSAVPICRPGGHQARDRARRQPAECPQSSEGMPVQHPLPAQDREDLRR